MPGKRESAWDTEAGALARTRIMELRRDSVEFVEIGRLLWEAGEWPTDPNREKPAPTRQSVWVQWQKTLRSIPAPAMAELRAELMGRLEEQYRRAQDILDRRHVAHSNGQVVYITEDGTVRAVEDDAPAIAAIREQRMIVGEISNLMGARIPVAQKLTVDAEVKYSVVGVDPGALT